MAITQFTVAIVDGKGKRATTRFYVNLVTASTLAQVQTGILPMLGLLNGVTGGKIVSVKYHQPIDISGLTPNTPSSDLVVNSTGVLSWPNAVDAHPWDFGIPAILGSLVSGNTLVQTEDGAIDLLTDVMGAAFDVHGTNDATFTDEDGNNLALEPRGFHTSRKYGKRVKGASGSLGV